MATMHHQVWIDAPVSKVYDALATAEGLGQWWTPHIATGTGAGIVLSHDPCERHGEVKMLVLEATPEQRIEWEIVSTHPADSPASAWTGTHISFEMHRRDNPRDLRGIQSDSAELTVLEFRHSGWDKGSDYFGFCNFAWAETLLMLKRWCEAE